MKFQIGDRVVKINLQYFQNPFHYKDFMIEYVVKDSNEVFFSPFTKVTDFSRSDTGLIYKQVDGQVLNSNVLYKLFHKVKDANEIQEIIDLAISDYNNFCSKNDLDEIAKLETQILQIQKKIDKIKSGNGFWTLGFTTYLNTEYLEKVKSSINKVFKIKYE